MTSKKVSELFPVSTKPLFDHADIIIGIFYDNKIRILKNRFNDELGSIGLNELINHCSYFVSKTIFKEGNMKIFQEGLSIEIRRAIHEAIDKFHKKGGE